MVSCSDAAVVAVGNREERDEDADREEELHDRRDALEDRARDAADDTEQRASSSFESRPAARPATRTAATTRGSVSVRRTRAERHDRCDPYHYELSAESVTGVTAAVAAPPRGAAMGGIYGGVRAPSSELEWRTTCAIARQSRPKKRSFESTSFRSTRPSYLHARACVPAKRGESQRRAARRRRREGAHATGTALRRSGE